MMKRDRLEYFLNTKDISDEEYDELVDNYFKANKLDWFEEKGKHKVWDKKKVSEFWELIRIQAMPRSKELGHFLFSYFVFPEFELMQFGNAESRSFWDKTEDKCFDGSVHFQETIFLGEVDFNTTAFEGKTSFKNCLFGEFVQFGYSSFKGDADFKSARFLGSVDFIDIDFAKPTNFSSVEFEGESNFSNTKFFKKVDFETSTFSKQVLFGNSRFIQKAHFVGVTFKGELNITSAKFLKSTLFSYSTFSGKVDFEMVTFAAYTDFSWVKFKGNMRFRNITYENGINFSNIHFSEGVMEGFQGDNRGLDFSKTTIPKTMLLRFIDLTDTSFLQANIAEAQFRECHWGNGSRIILKDEFEAFRYRKTPEHYASLEEVYRQLKKNFDSNKDWELSGKAYVSEMEMRKKRLWKQGDYFHWLIYAFYDVFGGYTQNLKKPIFWLFRLIVVFSCIYYPIDQSVQWAIQRSIYGALPKLITIDIPKDAQFNGYWLIAANIETILGSTFLVFFILALRKRFKQ